MPSVFLSFAFLIAGSRSFHPRGGRATLTS
jgi:hypothetical protein